MKLIITLLHEDKLESSTVNEEPGIKSASPVSHEGDYNTPFNKSHHRCTSHDDFLEPLTSSEIDLRGGISIFYLIHELQEGSAAAPVLVVAAEDWLSGGGGGG